MSIQGTPTSGIRWLIDAAGEIVGYRNPVTDQDAGVTPVASYTAAELSAMALAGTLTPLATYVASDTGVETMARTADVLVRKPVTANFGGSKTIAFFGTSITQSGGQVSLYGYRISTTVNGFTSSYWAILWADPETPSGVGNWAFNSTTKTATWAAFGESAGVAVDVSRSGIYYLPSSVAGHGLTIVWAGSSTAYTSGTTTVTVPADGNQHQAMWAARGYPACALMQAGPSWTVANTNVYPFGIACGGVPGMGAQVQVDAMWQSNQITAEVDIIEQGTNDIAAGTSAAQLIALLTTLINGRLALGTAHVGVLTIPPRDGLTTAKLRTRAQVNRWIYDYCAADPRLECLDTAAATTDPDTGGWITGYSDDTIHPNPLGAWAMGSVISRWLISLNAAAPFLPDGTDVYDATTNPYGIWQSAAGYNVFAGTGGSATLGGSGVVPANYNLKRQAGTIAAVGSKVVRTDGVAGSWYQIVITGGGAGEYMRLDPQSNPITLGTLGLVVGDQIEGFLEVNIPASVGLRIVNFLLTWSSVSGRYVSALLDPLGSNNAMQDSPGKFWLRIPPSTIPVGATAVGIYIRAGADTSATVQFGRWSIKKTSPA